MWVVEENNNFREVGLDIHIGWKCEIMHIYVYEEVTLDILGNTDQHNEFDYPVCIFRVF